MKITTIRFYEDIDLIAPRSHQWQPPAVQCFGH
ncbi:hypothetical protein [Aurantimonas coralicida]